MEKDNPIDFKTYWNKQEAPVPNQEVLFKKINKHRVSGLKKLILLNLCMLLTALFIVFVWVYFKPQFLSTKIGIVVVVLAILIYLLVYNKTIPIYKQLKVSESNTQYLENLIKLKKQEAFIQTKMVNLYFLLLSLGIGLYMYEYTSRMTLLWGVVVYGVVLLWFAFNWFYMRPRQIKKCEQKTGSLIHQLEEIIGSFDTDE